MWRKNLDAQVVDQTLANDRGDSSLDHLEARVADRKRAVMADNRQRGRRGA